MAKQQDKSLLFNFFLYILYVSAAIALAYFLWNGYEYYSTPLALRVRHPSYKFLKPGGYRSHGLGILGSLMLLSLLFYSIRKRIEIFQHLGRLSNWLKIHIFFGIAGPLFIILHSTFKLNGLVSVSFWSMIAVALSGILGRFLYNQIPRSIYGKELSLEEAESDAARLRETLQQEFGLSDADTIRIKKNLYGADSAERSFLNLLFSGLYGPLRQRKLKQILLKTFHIPIQEVHHIVVTAEQRFLLERRIALWTKIHRLFHYWHVFHKPFAIIMYVIMFVHISVSVWLGYTWIF